MSFAGSHFIVVREIGILKVGMRCYCMWETDYYVYMYFEYALVADVHEVKIAKKDLTNFRIVL